MQNFEDEIAKQIKIFSRGESYLYIKQELQDKYDEVTASKIAQEAYKRFRLKKTKRDIISGLVIFVVTQIGISFVKDESVDRSYIFRSILGICMIVYGLWEVYKFRKHEYEQIR
ncbi:MAG: hypothetical protein ACK4YV_07535 [Emticicia sp.]